MLIGLLALLPLRLQASALRICVDQDAWFPFTFVEDGQVRGMHIDIIRRAAEQLGHQLDLRPLPWRRCLLEAEAGSVDGIATLSYDQQRSTFLHFPADAELDAESRHSVLVADDVVVVASSDRFRFAGDLSTLPQPLRAPRAWGIVGFLREFGVAVDDSANGEESALRQLLRDGNGAAIAIRDSAELLLHRPDFVGRLRIESRPIRSRAYFLAFSRRSAVLDDARRHAFWQQLTLIRADRRFMADLARAYLPAADPS